jgi:hypothetical protein
MDLTQEARRPTRKETSMPGLLSNAEVEGRLNCFGEFDPKDRICMNHCALSIGCAVAKNRYFALQTVEESFANYIRFDIE